MLSNWCILKGMNVRNFLHPGASYARWISIRCIDVYLGLDNYQFRKTRSDYIFFVKIRLIRHSLGFFCLCSEWIHWTKIKLTNKENGREQKSNYSKYIWPLVLGRIIILPAWSDIVIASKIKKVFTFLDNICRRVLCVQ